jgi:hypothetical protein
MNFSKYTQTNKNELFPPTAGIKFIGEKYRKILTRNHFDKKIPAISFLTLIL